MLHRTTLVLVFLVAAPAYADEWRGPPKAEPAASSHGAPGGVWQGGAVVLPPGAAEILRTSRAPKTIIVGDPAIVDATLIGEGIIAVTAKGTGVTNLILLDANQAEITRGVIRVGPAPRSVQVMQGDKPQEYACTTGCTAVAAPPPSASYTTTYATRDAQGNPTTTTATTTTTLPNGVMPPVPPGVGAVPPR
jgi:hypothetical protein